ncbi:MAG: zinc ribbon domain-containing protein [Polyangiaceae bacterium]|nr:zinc ribbon domain-containing protein [Polyangiaceae bacterium]
MFCPNCGTQNQDSATTCTKCGFNLKGAAAPKFKGTMLMMNAPAGIPRPGDAPGGAASGPPAAPAPPAAPKPSLKGTMLGVAPPSPGAAPRPPAPAAPPPAPAAAPPAPRRPLRLLRAARRIPSAAPSLRPAVRPPRSPLPAALPRLVPPWAALRWAALRWAALRWAALLQVAPRWAALPQVELLPWAVLPLEWAALRWVALRWAVHRPVIPWAVLRLARPLVGLPAAMVLRPGPRVPMVLPQDPAVHPHPVAP